MVYKPIIIKDTKDLINNPRQEFLEESKNKIIGRKGIILKGHVTERERIKKLLEESGQCNIIF